MESQRVTSRPANGEKSSLADIASVGRVTGGEPQARILYVDDEPQIRRLGKLVLVGSGYDVDTAADGAEAWAALKEATYNLLIMDNDMPRLTGLELAARVRQAGMCLPILLTSGSSSSLNDAAIARFDRAAFLPKPFASDVLVKAVERALLSANESRVRAPVSLSAFARIAQAIQPHQHGGINE